MGRQRAETASGAVMVIRSPMGIRIACLLLGVFGLFLVSVVIVGFRDFTPLARLLLGIAAAGSVYAALDDAQRRYEFSPGLVRSRRLFIWTESALPRGASITVDRLGRAEIRNVESGKRVLRLPRAYSVRIDEIERALADGPEN